MKKYAVSAFIIWFVLILFLSSQNGSQAFGMTYKLALPFAKILYGIPDYDQILVVMNGIRFIGRVVAFVGFGVLFTVLIRSYKSKISLRYQNIILILGIIVFAVFDETHKLLIDGRHCTVGEIIVNIVCGLTGCVVTIYFIRKNLTAD